MKPAFLTLILLTCLPANAQRASRSSSDTSKDVPVSGYMRSDGIYVAPYWRSSPGTSVNGYLPLGNYYGPAYVPLTNYYHTTNKPMLNLEMSLRYDPSADEAMTYWIGRTPEALQALLGKPYKIHKQKDGSSLEYKFGAFQNERGEFFIDKNNLIIRCKAWGRD